LRTRRGKFHSLDERLSGIHRDTIMRLGVRVRETCQKLLDQKMRGLNCSRIEVDELWGFIGKKKTNASRADRAQGKGVITFLSIDSETKIIPSRYVARQRWPGIEKNHWTIADLVNAA